MAFNFWLDQAAQMPPDQAQINNAVLANGTPMSIAAPMVAVAPMPQKKQLPQMSEAFKSYMPNTSAVAPAETGVEAQRIMSKQALADQAAQLSGLNQYINDMAAKPRGVDYSALAAYVDSATGSRLAPTLQAMAPMSQDEKDKMLFGLKNQLAQGQASLSAAQLKAQKEEQDRLETKRHQDEIDRHNLAMEAKGAGTGDAQSMRAQTMMGNQALQQVARIHDDSAIKQMRQQATNIDKGLDLMAVPNVSNKALSEVAQDISAALAGKAAASDFKLRELMTPSLKQKLSDSVAYLTSNPDQAAPAETVKFWKDMGSRLQRSYDEQLSARAQGKLAGVQTAAKLNPMAFEAAKEAADLYKDGKWRVLEGRAMPGSLRQQAETHDSEAVKWAKANPSDPRAAKIMQMNGG